MAVKVEERTVLLIDRTIPEILRKNKEIEAAALLKFCSYLKRIGADLIEIDATALRYIGAHSDGSGFLFRVGSEDELEICRQKGFSYCVIDYEQHNAGLLRKARKKNCSQVILEVETDHTDGLRKLKDIDLTGVYAVRLLGFSCGMGPEWLKLFSEIREKYAVKLDVCPVNSYNLATATAYETVLQPGGPEFVSVAFAGASDTRGFAALEEVVMALRIIGGVAVRGETEILPEASRLYHILSLREISDNKPIIGLDIFKVESGIHIDGIAKNPSLYEPYDPAMVGKKRKLLIGKHSGSASIRVKLKQLGLGDQEKHVEIVQELISARCSRLKRSLEDHELLTIFARSV